LVYAEMSDLFVWADSIILAVLIWQTLVDTPK